MRKKLKIFVLVAVVMLLAGIGVESVLAYANRGSVQVSVSENNITLEAGQTGTVTATVTPAQQMETVGCGTSSCPQICPPGCSPDGYDCTCAGTAMYPYYPTVTASSSNTNVAAVSVNPNRQVIIQAIQPGTATITVTGNLRQYTSSSQQVSVTVTGTGSAPVQQGGIITSIAGNGTSGYAGDNGPATEAELSGADGVVMDKDGNLFIADSNNNRIREVAAVSGTQYGISMTAGDIYAVAGNGTRGYAGDSGPATAAELNQPLGVTVDAAGNIYIADTKNYAIRKVDTSGLITTVVGNGTNGYNMDNGPVNEAELIYPYGVAVDAVGNLFIADYNNIREVASVSGTQYGISMTAGNIYIVAGKYSGYNGDNIPATTACMATLESMVVDAAGNLYFTDTSNHMIREVAATTHTQYGIAMTAGYIYDVAGAYSQTGAGSYAGDGGLATWASLNSPSGVAVDAAGNIYIADNRNLRIREVAATTGTQNGISMTAGYIYTVAGNGEGGDFTGNGGPATSAVVSSPNDVAVDAAGNLYITASNRVLMVEPNSGISPASAVFDLNLSDSVYHAAIPVTVPSNGIKLTGITNGSYTLAPGSDYTLDGDVCTINTSYLDNLTAGTTPVDLIFNFNDGKTQTLALTVEDTTAHNSSISPTTAIFDLNSSGADHQAIPVNVTGNGNTLTGITKNDVPLNSGDYSVDGDVCTINTSYLDTLTVADSPINLTFNFSSGSAQTLTVTLENTDMTPSGSLSFQPSGGAVTPATQITITPTPSCVGQAVYWSETGSPPQSDQQLYNPNTGFYLSKSGTVYAAVYDSETSSWIDQILAPFTVYAQGGDTDTLDATAQDPLNGQVTVALPSADGHAVAINLGGNVSLNIPAGANLPTSITVSGTSSGTGNVFVLSASGGSYSDGFGTDVSITLPVPAGLSNPQVYYQVSPGIYELLEGTVNGDGTVTFTTSHFSTYAVASGSAVQPAVSPGAGTYNGSQTVTLSSSGAAKMLYYTSTGTAPTSFDYTRNYIIVPSASTTLTISSTENLVAVGVDANGFCSAPLIVAYTINTSSGGGGGGGSGVVSYKPAVNTGAATSVTTTSAVLSGTITADNGYDVTDYGFLWGTSQGSLTNKLAVGTDNHSGSFTATLDSLTAGQTYYFQAYASNSQGTTAGPVMSFTAAAAFQTTVPTPAPTSGSGQVFSDVPASFWGYQAISGLSSQGIVAGYPGGTFKPDASITRAEFAAMLVKAMKIDSGNTTGQFTDVTAKDWCYGAVNAAAASGLVSGTGDHLFSPNALITREQMAAMIVRALGSKAPTVSGSELDAFSDRSFVSTWAVTGMEQAVKAGIVSGMNADTLAPKANATRAQAAGMIYKLLSVLGD